jgi:hypothetical protein
MKDFKGVKAMGKPSSKEHCETWKPTSFGIGALSEQKDW